MAWYVGLDLETTGLSVAVDEPMEIFAGFYRDVLPADPTAYEVGYEAVLRSRRWEAREVADGGTEPAEVVVQMHERSGLAEAYETSSLILPADADTALTELADDLRALDGGSMYLFGSGVAEFDRPFLRKFFPGFESRLHYRTIDMGMVRRWFRDIRGVEVPKVVNENPHRARSDVYAAIELSAKLAEQVYEVVGYEDMLVAESTDG